MIKNSCTHLGQYGFVFDDILIGSDEYVELCASHLSLDVTSTVRSSLVGKLNYGWSPFLKLQRPVGQGSSDI